MYEYHDIRTKEDAQQLLEQFDNFSGARITDITYHGNVRAGGGALSISAIGTELSLMFLAASSVVEIVFRDVLDWVSGIRDSFTDFERMTLDIRPDTVFWQADVLEDPHDNHAPMQIWARSARWRLVDQPGLRLTQQKRGGCSGGWRYIPLPADCPTEDLVSIFRQLEKSTDGGKLAIVRPAGAPEDGMFAPENLLLTKETLPSFMQEEAIAAPAGEPFAWYRITDDADLRRALEYAMNGAMLGVIEDGHFNFTIEIIHTEYCNVVFQDWRDCLRSNLFVDNTCFAELYMGGGVEEFVAPSTPFPKGKAKYKSVNEAELFEFHDAEIRPLQLQNGIFRGVVQHLNIHGHTTHNPEEFDRELDSALLHMDRFRLAEEDGGLIDVMRHPFTVLKLDVEKADGHFLAKLEAVTEKHKPFFCTFYFDTIKITWNHYQGKAWYVKPTQ